MSKIRILSEQLANQIAAGEVVERPASVVKELLENSIDAGARTIGLEVDEGGTGLIRVLDDGEGMDADDLLLALERHATSKLRDAAGLGTIATLGFRGEALPSIASVSRFVMVSRPREASVGNRIEQRFGRMQGCHETGAAKGTRVEVRDLFANVPARRKFLKSRRTELYHIEETLRDQALAHPEISFSLMVDGRLQWQLEATTEASRRLVSLLRYQGLLLPLAGGEGNEQGLSCDGWLLEPDAPGGQGRQLHVLVNGRPVRNFHLQRTVTEAMSGYLLQGRQPAGLLRLRLLLDEVDVNVHPAKREVRFRDMAAVRNQVAAAVRRGLSWYEEQRRTALFAPAVMESQGSGPEPPMQMPAWQAEARVLPITAGGCAWESRPLLSTAEPAGPGDDSLPPAVSAPSGESAPASPALVPLAQLFELYLLCTDGEQLVIIDQHAAHERILYEQLQAGYGSQPLASQQLLHPRSLELSPREMDLLERHGEILTRLGFRWTPFGGDTVLLQALPALLGSDEPEGLLREVLESLHLVPAREGTALPGPAFAELCSRLACRAAIKSGTRLSSRETLDLLARMQSSAAFAHCPHGRPVARQFTRAEIEKWFHRT